MARLHLTEPHAHLGREERSEALPVVGHHAQVRPEVFVSRADHGVSLEAGEVTALVGHIVSPVKHEVGART